MKEEYFFTNFFKIVKYHKYKIRNIKFLNYSEVILSVTILIFKTFVLKVFRVFVFYKACRLNNDIFFCVNYFICYIFKSCNVSQDEEERKSNKILRCYFFSKI
ncbi:hypothetical protein EDEG_03788 [Edhazardia aedis USNM 41457]|uniref:Uncharacterized protein n=1 Tax=Edhazardia aedis (strain USNM 41457) TaxID=1003232 RepID=J9D1F6_EDHAE|nr:hypothetical protein EDEG_03788 [Edhazardia aedis USNM 41457]|eukprot:EJW01666.1 hypothetical protein EDEG_03788 [Edhazardia aedis USNM 41457]